MAEKSASTTHDAAPAAPKETHGASGMAHPLHRMQRAAGNRAVAAAVADRGEGEPLPDSLRATFEPLFAHPLDRVRIHHAEGVDAKAFTHGSDIYFGSDAYRPDTHEGQTRIAHELTHTVQQQGAHPVNQVSARDDRDEVDARANADRVMTGLPAQVRAGVAESAIQCDDPPPAGYKLSEDPDQPLTPIDPPVPDDDAAFLHQEETFPIVISEQRPEFFIVPENATRRQIAKVLLGDETLDSEFDFVVPPEGGRGVRMRNPNRLVPEALAMAREIFDDLLVTDIEWMAAKLNELWIDDAEEWELAEHLLYWSQRSNFNDDSGKSYFDVFLDDLEGTWLGDRNALQGLLAEASNKKEQILKAITLRSSRDVGYVVTDQEPAPDRGDVVGRFYSSSGSGVQLIVIERTVVESTLERAETIVRNTAPMPGLLRVIIPGSDGMYYGYVLADTTIDDLMIMQPEEDSGGRYYWYYPGTIPVLHREFEADFPQGQASTIDLRRAILDEALAANSLAALVMLDFSALSLATIEERVSMLTLALESDGGSASADFMARLIYTTPNDEFPFLERQMSDLGLIDRFRQQTISNPEISVVGRIFSIKTMTALPIGAESITDMPSFTVGYDEDGKYHFALVQTTSVESTLIAPDAWDPQSAIRVGHEPAGPGDSPGPITRSALVFEPASVRGGMGNFLMGAFQVIDHVEATAPKSRALLPTELVEIHEIGVKPRTMIVSALEASALLALNFEVVMRNLIMPAVDVTVLASGGLGLLRAFGPAVAEGVAAGGIRAGLAAVAETAGTQAGKAALKSALITGVLVGGSRVIDTYREELEQSPEGRALIAAWDVAMLALLARDIHAIANSGIVGRISQLASRTYATLSEAAALRLRNAVDDLRALELAVQRLQKAEAAAPALAATGSAELGTAAMAMVDRPELGALFSVARGEVRAARVVSTLKEAGASTVVAERVFARLQKLAGANKSMATAHREIASKASSLAATPEALDEFLLAIEKTVGAARANTADRISGYLLRSTTIANPVAFLDDVQWLLKQPGISADAIETMGGKVLRGRLDLAWLRTTNLTQRDISAMGANPNTVWEIFQRVSQGTAAEGELKWAMRSTRGIAAELLARRDVKTYFPGNRVSASQVKVGDSVIDHVLTSTEGLARRRGLEVKGWTPDTWKDAFAAYKKRTIGVTLSDAEGRMADRIERMLRQLENAKTALGNAPVLAISDGIRAADEAALVSLLKSKLPDVQIVKMSDAAIVEMGNELRSAMNFPARGAPE